MQLNIYGISFYAEIFSKYIEDLFKSEYSFWKTNTQIACDESLHIKIFLNNLYPYNISNARVLYTDKNVYYFKGNIVFVKTHDEDMIAKINVANNCILISIKSEDIESYLFCKAVVNSFVAYLLKKNGVYRIHGAVLAKEKKVIVFLGSSGSGKSTSAYYLHKEGFSYFGDDILYLKLNEEGVDILPYPNYLSTDMYEDNDKIKFKDGYRTKSLVPINTTDFPMQHELYLFSLSLSTFSKSIINNLSLEEKSNILSASFTDTPFEHFTRSNVKDKFNIIFSIIKNAKIKEIILGLEKESFVEAVNSIIMNPMQA